MKLIIVLISSLFVYANYFSSSLNIQDETGDFSSRTSAYVPDNKSNAKEIKVAGKILFTFDHGDFVYPTFSPEGNQIAYASVLIEEDDGTKFENTEIHLFDFQKRKKTILLDSKRAKKYAVYKSFVSDLFWLGPDKLEASISDGDVDSTILTFDTKTNRVIKEGYSSGDDFDYEAFNSPELQGAFAQLTKLFPDIPKNVARTGFDLQQAFKIAEKGLVTQFGYNKVDRDIWFFDFKDKKKILLLKETEKDSKFSLIGAAESSNGLFFIVGNDTKTEFYTYSNEKSEKISETDFDGGFQPIFKSKNRLFFLLKQPNYQSELKSSLWLFQGVDLARVTDVEDLCDAAVDATGNKIAFSFWVNDEKRHLSVRELKKDF